MTENSSYSARPIDNTVMSSFNSLKSETGDATRDPSDGVQVVLILVGLVGSGKVNGLFMTLLPCFFPIFMSHLYQSTFAEALQWHCPHWKRCNQDDLGGNRKNVEHLARVSLRKGFSVCIDRTNLDTR